MSPRRSQRITGSGPRLNYDAKYHPMDEQVRPHQAKKRRLAHMNADDLEQSDDEALRDRATTASTDDIDTIDASFDDSYKGKKHGRMNSRFEYRRPLSTMPQNYSKSSSRTPDSAAVTKSRPKHTITATLSHSRSRSAKSSKLPYRPEKWIQDIEKKAHAYAAVWLAQEVSIGPMEAKMRAYANAWELSVETDHVDEAYTHPIYYSTSPSPSHKSAGQPLQDVQAVDGALPVPKSFETVTTQPLDRSSYDTVDEVSEGGSDDTETFSTLSRDQQTDDGVEGDNTERSSTPSVRLSTPSVRRSVFEIPESPPLYAQSQTLHQNRYSVISLDQISPIGVPRPDFGFGPLFSPPQLPQFSPGQFTAVNSRPISARSGMSHREFNEAFDHQERER